MDKLAGYGSDDDYDDSPKHRKTEHATSYDYRNNHSRQSTRQVDVNYEEVQMDLSEDSNSDSSKGEVQPSRNERSSSKSSKNSDRRDNSRDEDRYSRDSPKYRDYKPKREEDNARFRGRDEREEDNDRYNRGRAEIEEDNARYKGRDEREEDNARYKGRDEREEESGRYRAKDEREEDSARYRARDERKDDRDRYKSRNYDDKYKDKQRDDRSRSYRSRRSSSRERRSRSPRKSDYRSKRSNSKDRDSKSNYSRRYERNTAKSLQEKTESYKPVEQPNTKAEPDKDRFYMPGITGRFKDQIERRKLLWQKKEPVKKDTVIPVATTAGKVWQSTTFAQDTDGKVASKFKRLMGIREPNEGGKGTTDTLKKQEEMFSSMEQQYEVARTATHTMRGVGLGFGSFQR